MGNINTIEHDIRLITASAIDSTAPGVGRSIESIAEIRNARLKTQQLDYVASFNGELRHLLRVESVADRRVRCI